MVKKLIGWDIGGAHVKAVLMEGNGPILKAEQVVCPLWKGMDQLSIALQAILKLFEIGPQEAQHAVTMTGELVDLFDDRITGVKAIAQLMIKTLSNHVWFYRATSSLSDCFIGIDQIESYASSVASANWHASAQWLASQVEHAIFVDIGSTTTDVVCIEHNRVVLKGLSDAERMQQGSLVYTGVVRTPVMAIAQTLKIEKQQTFVAAEHFATMADVYRLTKELPQSVDVAETADGKDKSLTSSARRLARMVGYDVEDKSMQAWRSLAENCRQTQMNLLATVVKPRLTAQTPIIGAGAGVFLVKALAKHLGQPFKPMHTVLPSIKNNVDTQQVITCFPAYAIAQLAIGRL